MEPKLKYAIHFYTEQDAYVNVTHLADEDRKEFSEIFIFCSFTIRIISQIGQKHPVCVALATTLSLVEDSRVPLIIWVANPDFRSNEPSLRNVLINGIRIVNSSQNNKVKGFTGILEYDNHQARHDITPEGFNLLGQGIPYYAPLSVGLLLNYLGKRPYGEKFIKSLSVAAKLCGQTILDNPLSKHASIYWAMEMTKLAVGE